MIETLAPPALDAPEAAGFGWLRMAFIRGFGPRERRLLFETFDDPAQIFEMQPAELGARLRHAVETSPDRDELRLPRDPVGALLAPRALHEARVELARVRHHELGLWTRASPRYPELLHEVDDPPFFLMARGSLETVPARTIAIVGSRRANPFELRFARDLARALAAQGIVVASGLAKGIDRAAHEGALEAPGGRTVAVLGCGLARVYPTSHAELAEAICERGALLSEFPVDAPPLKHHFPQRNRVVSGLAAATVVVAAHETSGALITARHALDQNREVFTIPGRLDDPTARGTNLLLKRGNAHLIEGPEDVLIALGWRAPSPEGDERPPLFGRQDRERLPGLPGQVEILLAGGAARTFEDLSVHGRFDPRALVLALGRLQSLGRVRERGGFYELTD